MIFFTSGKWESARLKKCKKPTRHPMYACWWLVMSLKRLLRPSPVIIKKKCKTFFRDHLPLCPPGVSTWLQSPPCWLWGPPSWLWGPPSWENLPMWWCHRSLSPTGPPLKTLYNNLICKPIFFIVENWFLNLFIKSKVLMSPLLIFGLLFSVIKLALT